MKSSLKIVLSLCLIIASLFSIYFFRILPSIRIWDSYKVFYIDKSIDFISVFSDFEKSYKDGIISKESQKYPEENNLTPIMGEYSLQNFSSIELRDIFFQDKNDNYQLFYVENDFSEIVAKFLKEKDIDFGTDHTSAIPIVCPIVCFVFILVFSILTKSKLRFFIAKLPFVLFSYSIPYYSVAIAICCFISFYFIIEKFLLRKDLKKLISKKPFIYFLGFVSFVLICLCGFRAILFFILALIASLGFIYFSSFFSRKYVYGFAMKTILPIHYVNTTKELNVLNFGIGFALVFFLTICFFYSSIFSSNISENNLFLPAPSEYTDDVLYNSLEENYSSVKISMEKETEIDKNLPNIFDFVDENWILATYPYRILGLDSNKFNKNYLGETINFPMFSKTSNGFVKQEEVQLFNFNEEYLKNSIYNFEKSSGVEKLLVSQQPFTTITYSSKGKTENSKMMWIVVFFGLAFFGSITTICVIKRQIK